jgi:hypothetical protein
MTDQLVAILVVVALVAALLLAIAVVVLAVRLRRLRRDYQAALGSGRREDLFAAVRRQVDEIASLRTDLEVVNDNTELLDERGDGMVVSAINGRSETRTYAKAVHGGASEHHLSDEEETAIRRAMTGEGPIETTTVASRRRRRAG